MPIGSGISAQLMTGEETTVGTAVTVDRAYEFTSEAIDLTKNIVQGLGLHASGQYRRAPRRSYTTRGAAGNVVLDFPIKGAGRLLKHMLGTPAPTATQQGATIAYLQTHIPGPLTGRSQTIQVGRPQTDGTVKPFTYSGAKIPTWEMACAVGGILQLTLTIDAWDVTTATGLATASYPTGNNVFHFAQGSVLLGGTASTASGVTSISGGATAANIRAITVHGDNPMKVDRYFLGSAGLKAEQIENDYRNITGSCDCEFVNQATIYDVFAADTATALELKFVGANIASTYYYTLDVLIPNLHWDTAPVQVGGPDVIGFTANFTGLDDGTNNPIQAQYTSTDTAV